MGMVSRIPAASKTSFIGPPLLLEVACSETSKSNLPASRSNEVAEPPGLSCCSTRVTGKPCRTKIAAAESPPSPPPMTTIGRSFLGPALDARAARLGPFMDNAAIAAEAVLINCLIKLH